MVNRLVDERADFITRESINCKDAYRAGHRFGQMDAEPAWFGHIFGSQFNDHVIGYKSCREDREIIPRCRAVARNEPELAWFMRSSCGAEHGSCDPAYKGTAARLESAIKHL